MSDHLAVDGLGISETDERVGRKAIPPPAIPVLYLPGQEVMSVYITPLHHQTGGEVSQLWVIWEGQCIDAGLRQQTQLESRSVRSLTRNMARDAHCESGRTLQCE
jgi:hypothetical protein